VPFVSANSNVCEAVQRGRGSKQNKVHQFRRLFIITESMSTSYPKLGVAAQAKYGGVGRKNSEACLPGPPARTERSVHSVKGA
jgi:hypothetical protein